MLITRRLEFDAGHRIPSHSGKCRNFHGHRYALEVTFEGEVKLARGKEDDGMVVDFSNLRALMAKYIVDQWDHGFLVYKEDQKALWALQNLGPDHKTVILEVVPTVENLAQLAFDILSNRMYGGIKVSRVRLYETPNCWADVTAKED